MAVRSGDYSFIQPALDYLNRTYGIKPADVAHLTVDTEAAGVTALTVKLWVKAEDLSDQPDERLRLVPFVKPPIRDEPPREEPYAIATCMLCNARIWAYGIDKWRGCSDRFPHEPTPTLVVPLRDPS